jgi:hypothetical protein
MIRIVSANLFWSHSSQALKLLGQMALTLKSGDLVAIASKTKIFKLKIEYNKAAQDLKA